MSFYFLESFDRYNISDLVREAQTRWLKPAEVYFILQNYDDHMITHEPAQRPASGFLFLFNKRVFRNFRRDGHTWRRKKDGRSGEAHERLKEISTNDSSGGEQLRRTMKLLPERANTFTATFEKKYMPSNL